MPVTISVEDWDYANEHLPRIPQLESTIRQQAATIERLREACRNARASLDYHPNALEARQILASALAESQETGT
jgi:hypothetical protein